jgi:hypothetical protein
MTSIKRAALGVMTALARRTDCPIFSSDWHHADNLLRHECRRLNAALLRSGRSRQPLDLTACIRYATQAVRTQF